MEATLTDEYIKDLEEYLRATHCDLNHLIKLKHNPNSEDPDIVCLDETKCINLYKHNDSILFFDDEFRDCFIEKNFDILLGTVEGNNELVILEKKHIKFIYLIINNQIALTFIDPWTYYDSINWQSIKNEFCEIQLDSDILAKSEEDYKKEFLADHIIFKCLEFLPKDRPTELLPSLYTLLNMAGLYPKIYPDLSETLGIGSQYCLVTGIELPEKGYFSNQEAYRSFIKPKGKSMFPKLLKLSECNFSSLKYSVEDFVKAFKKFVVSINKQKINGPLKSMYHVSLEEDIRKYLSNSERVAYLLLYRNVSEKGDLHDLSILKELIEYFKDELYSQVTFICQEVNLREIILNAVHDQTTQLVYRQLKEDAIEEISKYNPQFKLYSKSRSAIEFIRWVAIKRGVAKNLQKLFNLAVTENF